MRSAGPKLDDRRKYTVGQYALVLLDVLTVQVGKITEVQDEIVTLKLFPSKGFKVSITEAGEIKTQYQNLLPGDFRLTASRKLPTNIQSIIKDGNYKLW